MKYFYIISFVLFILTQNLYSQGWINMYDTGWGSKNFSRDSDGSFIIHTNAYLLKTDTKGNEIWRETVSSHRLNSFLLTPNDNFLLLETILNPNPDDFYEFAANVTLLNGNREFQWEYQLEESMIISSGSDPEGTRATAAIQDKEGNFFVLGVFKGWVNISAPYYDSAPFLMKITADGEGTFLERYQNTVPPLNYGFQSSLDIVETDDGFVLLTIVDQDFTHHDRFPGFTKVDKEGQLVWTQYFGAEYPSPGYLYSVAPNIFISKQEEIISAGLFGDMTQLAPYLMILDSTGALESFVPIELPEEIGINLESEAVDFQRYGNDYVLLFDRATFEGDNKYYFGFVVIDKSGKTLFYKYYNEVDLPSNVSAQRILVLEEGGFAISGGGLDLWLMKTHSLGNCYPDTDFSFTAEGEGLYAFENHSLNADTYHWTTGDGRIVKTESFSHQYTENGVYEVCLTARNKCEPFTLCKNVEVSEITDIEVYEWEQGLLVYPNPVHNTRLFVEIPQKNESPMLTLYNSFGQQVQSVFAANTLNTYGLEAGIYYLQIQIGTESTVRKVLVY